MSPILKSRLQPVRVGVLFPRGVYSRVVLVQLVVPAGAGSQDHATTPPLGNQVWLLGVDLWYMPVNHPGFLSNATIITAGTGENATFADVALRWTPIMDVSRLLPQGILIYCCAQHFGFEMNKLYAGESQRFGVAVSNLSNQQFVVLVGFRISEG